MDRRSAYYSRSRYAKANSAAANHPKPIDQRELEFMLCRAWRAGYDFAMRRNRLERKRQKSKPDE